MWAVWENMLTHTSTGCPCPFHLTVRLFRTFVLSPSQPNQRMPTPRETATGADGQEKSLSREVIVPENRPFSNVLEADEHPQHLPAWRKWLVVFVISSSSLCVTCASSLVSLFVCCTFSPGSMDLLGRICRRWRIHGVSCWAYCFHTFHQPFRRRFGSRSTNCRSSFGGLWT